ncbi:MAG: hypothetical protein IKB01_09745 [Lachnospiraceae bacterium]|nr:hypothetical protein [Lachnospiraceae bacterium]
MKKLSFIGILMVLTFGCMGCSSEKEEVVLQEEYEFYLQGIYASSSGNEDKIYIQPIELIYEDDVEEIAKYKLENEDWAPGYYILDDVDESIALQINADTKYIIINWNDDQELIDNSTPDEDGFYCTVTDPTYFLQYMQKSYGEKLTTYPLYVKVGEDGYVEYVKEIMLP